MSHGPSSVTPAINIELPQSAADMVALGLAKADRAGRFTYANREILRISGLDDWRGHGVAELFRGDDLEAVMNGLQSRFDSLAGSDYEVNLTRPADGVVVPVGITAFPDTDDDGTVLGTLAIVRDLTITKAQQRIYRIVQEERTSKRMLEEIAKEIRQLVPFDQLSIFRLNRERTHLRNIFVVAPPGEERQTFRWWRIPASIEHLVNTRELLVFDDLPRWYDDPARSHLMEDIAVQEFVAKGYVSCLSYPIVRGGVRIASIGLHRKGFRPFTEEEQRVLKALPLSDAVSMALRNESESNLTFLIELMRHIASAYGSVGDVAQTIVAKIAEHYEWDDVSIFQVYEHRREIRLIAQWSREPSMAIDATGPIDIGHGILGKVFETKEARLIGDVAGSEFVDAPIPRKSAKKTLSQLCLPIGAKGLWLLNVEDERRDAFASEEKHDLEGIASELSALLDRTLEFRYRSAIFDRANDAIILTSGDGVIVEVNDAAIALLRVAKGEVIGRSIGDLLVDPALRPAILAPASLANQEVVLRRGPSTAPGEVKVLLSAASLPDDIDGRVFIATDMSLLSRVQQLKIAKALYRDVTSQVKTPMSLATAWLRRCAQGKGNALDDLAAKTLQQLRKVELTLDRMMLYEENGRDAARVEAEVEVRALVESILAEMPENERTLIDVRLGDGSPHVRADPYQLRYCLATILSYLIRLVPEDDGVVVRVARKARSVEIVLSGKGDEGRCAGDLDKAARHGQVLTEMSLGNSTLQALVEANGGKLTRTGAHAEKRIEFRMRFPSADGPRVIQ